MYTKPLSKVIETIGMEFHLYADHTQIYIAFQPKQQSSIINVKSSILQCTNAISAWMKSSFLKPNSRGRQPLVHGPKVVRETWKTGPRADPGLSQIIHVLPLIGLINLLSISLQ